MVGGLVGARIFARAGLLAGCLLLGGAAIDGAEAALSGAACRTAWDAYRGDRAAHSRRTESYWDQISAKRRQRSGKARRNVAFDADDFVQTFPPEYKGRAKPDCRDPDAKPTDPDKPREPSTLPIVADFLSAAEKEYAFVPHHMSDTDYMRQYAYEALKLGLTSDQVVGVYALETGGLGPYFRQSGIFNTDQECKPQAPKGRPASTALGYAQLLSANSSAMTHAYGNEFADELERLAAGAEPSFARHLRDKAGVVRQMVRDIGAYVRRVSSKNGWREYVSYGKSRKGLAVHALNLDVHIGPMLQTRKLRKIVSVAENKGYRNLSAGDLELLNLVGYGSGLQMLEPIAEKVPSSNFFSRGGYERNPVANGHTASGVRAKLAEIIARKMSYCGSVRFLEAFRDAASGRRADLGSSFSGLGGSSAVASPDVPSRKNGFAASLR